MRVSVQSGVFCSGSWHACCGLTDLALLTQVTCVWKREGSPIYPGSGVQGASWGSQPWGGVLGKGPLALGIRRVPAEAPAWPSGGVGAWGPAGEVCRESWADAAVSAPSPGEIRMGGVTLAQPALSGLQSTAGKCDPPGSPPACPPGMPLVLGEDHVLAAGVYASVSMCNASGCECVTVCVCVGSMPV